MASEKPQELLIDELSDLYDAEKQLVKALPRMARAAASDQVRAAFNEHVEVTRRQAERLEKAFELLRATANSRRCKGMLGLIEEGEEHVSDQPADSVDKVLIGGGKKVKQNEIAAYAGAHELREMIGNHQVSRLLKARVRQAA